MKASWIAACLALCALACGSDGDGDGDGDGDAAACDGTVPSFDEVTAFAQVCTNCHDSSLSAGARNGAPAGYDFDQYDSARDEAEDIAEEVDEGAMPPAGSGYTLSAAQKSQVIRWAECGAPE